MLFLLGGDNIILVFWNVILRGFIHFYYYWICQYAVKLSNIIYHQGNSCCQIMLRHRSVIKRDMTSIDWLRTVQFHQSVLCGLWFTDIGNVKRAWDEFSVFFYTINGCFTIKIVYIWTAYNIVFEDARLEYIYYERFKIQQRIFNSVFNSGIFVFFNTDDLAPNVILFYYMS